MERVELTPIQQKITDLVEKDKLGKAEKLLKNNPEELEFLLSLFIRKNAVKRALLILKKINKEIEDYPELTVALHTNSVGYLIDNFDPFHAEVSIRSRKELVLLGVDKFFKNGRLDFAWTLYKRYGIDKLTLEQSV